MDTQFVQQYAVIFILLAIWEIFWKGKALWKSAKQDQKYWFIALLIINTAGVLPLLYLNIFSKKST